jgi:hypothetical protein
MSEDYNIIALGHENFVYPFGLAGLEFKIVKNMKDAVKIINQNDLISSFFILDENIICDVKEIEVLEEKGANILIIKEWGRSKMANNKIRNASIKAIGVDMVKEKI